MIIPPFAAISSAMVRASAPVYIVCEPSSAICRRVWAYAFRTTNPPERGVVDGVTRWLVVTRAGVLPMTLTSGLIAVLLAAVADTVVDWLNVTLAVVGIAFVVAAGIGAERTGAREVVGDLDLSLVRTSAADTPE